MTYKIYSLGCKVNQYDSAKLAASFNKQGLKKMEDKADFAIIYTCSVTESAIKKNKRMIAKARKENPQAKIILAGCWPRAKEIKKEEFGVDFVLSDNNSQLWNYIFSKDDGPIDINGQASLIAEQSRARYFIKVQDGCEQFCSYCIIPYTRGPLKSRPKEEIIREIKGAVQKGFREIVLSGIHLGLYGYNTDYKLVNLVADILKIKNLGRVRLSSIELNEVTDDLIDLMAGNKLCQHLHIPLQSGCDKILHSMNRPYNTEQFRKKINQIRKIVPQIAITTDIIVGFPRETDEDFLITKKFIKKINFSRLHIFSFSAHKKTPAYSMPNQIEKKEIAKRAKILRKLSKKLEHGYQKKFKGKELEAVLENFNEKQAKLKTEYYFDVIQTKYNFCKQDIGKIRKIIIS